MKNILLLGSKSISRQKLLNDAKIPFKLIDQSSNEEISRLNKNLQQVVEEIAINKMDHAILPSGLNDKDKCYVLTADTMGIDHKGNIYGKPIDKNDAIRMLKAYRKGAYTGTAFCLDKKIWSENKWKLDKRVVCFVGAEYFFEVSDEWIEKYFELSIASGIHYTQVSGAVAIEEFGAQFLKSINGSYTAVVGLPMFELREALSEMNFWSNS